MDNIFCMYACIFMRKSVFGNTWVCMQVKAISQSLCPSLITTLVFLFFCFLFFMDRLAHWRWDLPIRLFGEQVLRLLYLCFLLGLQVCASTSGHFTGLSAGSKSALYTCTENSFLIGLLSWLPIDSGFLNDINTSTLIYVFFYTDYLSGIPRNGIYSLLFLFLNYEQNLYSCLIFKIIQILPCASEIPLT